MVDETGAIKAAAQTYLDGLYEGDADKLATVFHPMSALTWEQDGVLKPLSRDESSPTTAFVKLKCQLPPRFFTDYLCFLKIDGRWQIAQKIFSTEVRG